MKKALTEALPDEVPLSEPASPGSFLEAGLPSIVREDLVFSNVECVGRDGGYVPGDQLRRAALVGPH